MTEAGRLPAGPDESTEQQTFRWFMHPYDYLEQCRDRFGETFRLDISGYGPHVCVSNPAHVREVFTAPADTLLAGGGNEPLRPLLGDASMLLLDAEQHALHRRLLMPAFQESRLAPLAARIRAITSEAVNDLSDEPIHPVMVRISLDVIVEFVLGRTTKDPAAAEICRTLLDLLQKPSLSLKMFAPKGSQASRLARFDALIADEIERASPDGPGVISLLIASDLPRTAIRDELVTLLVAGHETTAATLAWATWFVASDPERSARARDNQDYLNATIVETLRVRPVIPVVSRRVAKPITIAGYDLQPGDYVMPCSYLVHRRPELYPDPEDFRPERWLTNRPSPAGFIPFGGGARRCIGHAFAMMEIREVLSTLLARFDIEAIGDPPAAVRSALMIVPSGGVPVRATARQA